MIVSLGSPLRETTFALYPIVTSCHNRNQANTLQIHAHYNPPVGI